MATKIESYVKQQDTQFKYMLLSRLQQDCEYFLGNGARNPRHLWADTVEEHITYMKELWKDLEIKPEWLTMGQIETYNKAMV